MIYRIQFYPVTVQVNNGHSMYWKQGKDFVDGRHWHMLDSVFANDPSDRPLIDFRPPMLIQSTSFPSAGCSGKFLVQHGILQK